MRRPRIVSYSVWGASCVGVGAVFSSGLGVGWVDCSLVTVCGLISFIKDLLWRTDKTARLRQVIKNTMDNTVVVRVRNAFVFVPNIDSTPEKLSAKPPPLPL